MASFGFRPPHYFGSARFAHFARVFLASPWADRVDHLDAPPACDEELTLFHTAEYVEHVRRACEAESGLLAHATPAERGLDGAAAGVVGAVLDGVRRLLAGQQRRLFVPIAGFHHARPTAAANYCLFNDCAIGIRYGLAQGLERIAYVDIDVHHGDGVWSAFADDQRVAVADIHQEPDSFWYGAETPVAPAKGKYAVSLPPGSEESAFWAKWPEVVAYLDNFRPQLVVLQAGADSLDGDRLGSLRFSPEVHEVVTRTICSIAERHGEGRVLVLGGGGYHLDNLAAAWTMVVRALVEAPIAVRSPGLL